MIGDGGNSAELAPQGSGENRSSQPQFSIDRPVDLVRNIRNLIQQERTKSSGDFNAAWFLRSEMTSIFNSGLFRGEPKEKQIFFNDLRVAWELVAYGELEDYRNEVYGDIRFWGGIGSRSSITLSPLGVTMLDAMAEATDIPHAQGQDTFDISLFTSPRFNYDEITDLRPTSEQVKQAITHSK